jgi:hypothetical protein
VPEHGKKNGPAEDDPNNNTFRVNIDQEGKGHYETFLLSVQPGDLQNPSTSTSNNPTILKTVGKSGAIKVNFGSGDFHGLPTGPGIWNNPTNGARIEGVGFTVTTTVTSGDLGHIGKTTINSSGAWTINQSASATGSFDGRPVTLVRPNDIGKIDFHDQSGANQYTYWDFPGLNVDDFKNRAHGRLNFDITATNGQQKCELKFRIDLDLGGFPQTVNWRRIR